MGKRELAKVNKDIRTIINERVIDDLKAVCETPKGRRFMRYLLKFCRVYNSELGANDAQTFFNIGTRQVGLHLIYLLQRVEPGLHLQMEREHHSEYINNEIRRDKAKAEGASE